MFLHTGWLDCIASTRTTKVLSFKPLQSRFLPFLVGWLKETGQSRLFLWRCLCRDFLFLRWLFVKEWIHATIGLRSGWRGSNSDTRFTWNSFLKVFVIALKTLSWLIPHFGVYIDKRTSVIYSPVDLDSGFFLCEFVSWTVLSDELIVSATKHWVVVIWAAGLDPRTGPKFWLCFFSGVSPTAVTPVTSHSWVLQ